MLNICKSLKKVEGSGSAEFIASFFTKANWINIINGIVVIFYVALPFKIYEHTHLRITQDYIFALGLLWVILGVILFINARKLYIKYYVNLYKIKINENIDRQSYDNVILGDYENDDLRNFKNLIKPELYPKELFKKNEGKQLTNIVFSTIYKNELNKTEEDKNFQFINISEEDIMIYYDCFGVNKSNEPFSEKKKKHYIEKLHTVFKKEKDIELVILMNTIINIIDLADTNCAAFKNYMLNDKKIEITLCIEGMQGILENSESLKKDLIALIIKSHQHMEDIGVSFFNTPGLKNTFREFQM